MKNLLHRVTIASASFVLLLFITETLHAQNTGQQKSMEIYGYIMLDAGYNFNQIDPGWADAVRPTKLPAFNNQFGTDGNVYFSVRQTRLGIKNYLKTSIGELKTFFEFEMYGAGVDVGQAAFHLRHAYAELGKFGVGQYWSPFMDNEIYPNIVEYWGPNGMVSFRNVQIRYMPIQGESRLTIALERPGASSDQGIYSDRIELADVVARFPLPDLSAEYRKAFKLGYVELAGIVRRIEWEDQNADTLNFSGDAMGWGVNLSTILKLSKKDAFRGQVVYGEGIQNYMNDAPVDIGIENNFSNTVSPVKGVALPVLGVVAYLDHTWNEKFSSSVGYSFVDIDNSDGQAPGAFKKGQYISANLLYHPTKNATAAIEYQWADRSNFSDGWNTSMSKIQLSFKYNFSQLFYNNQ